MTKQTEIPVEMIRAATATVLTRAGFNEFDYPEVHQAAHSRWIVAKKDATAILEAAGMAAMIQRIVELESLYAAEASL